MAYKTWKRVKVIQDVATSAEASAQKKVIFIGTGVPVTATDPFVYTLQITRSGVANWDVTNKAKHFYNATSGALAVLNNSPDYVITANDVITIMGTYV